MDEATHNRSWKSILFPFLFLLVPLVPMLAVPSCFNGGAQPDPSPATPDQLAGTIDPLFQRLETLEIHLATLSAPTPTQPARPTPNRTPPISQISTKTVPPTPVPAAPSLCGRSPQIQRAILHALDISLCQSVTNEDLYRLNKLEIDAPATLISEDFAGLAKLKVLHVTATGDFTIPTGAFQELESLTTLTITSRSPGIIQPGAFHALRKLQQIIIRIDVSKPNPETHFPLPILDHLPALTNFSLFTHNWITILKPHQFDHLPSLNTITIEGEIPNGDPNRSWQLPHRIFHANTALRTVDIQIGGYRSAIHAAADTFEHLDRLKYLNLGHSYQAHDQLRLSLSPNSPLFKHVVNDGHNPQGYAVLVQDPG